MVTTTGVPAGAVNLTGCGGGGGEAEPTGIGAVASVPGATAGAPLGVPAEPAELAGGAAGATLPSGFALCAGAPAVAGAGAGVELLHPPRISVAERAKLATKMRDFSRMRMVSGWS